MGLNYQTLHKIIERAADGYVEAPEMRKNLHFLRFQAMSFFKDAQLRSMHRNFGHPSVEKHMQLIEQAGYEKFSEDVGARLQKMMNTASPVN